MPKLPNIGQVAMTYHSTYTYLWPDASGQGLTSTILTSVHGGPGVLPPSVECVLHNVLLTSGTAYHCGPVGRGGLLATLLKGSHKDIQPQNIFTLIIFT